MKNSYIYYIEYNSTQNKATSKIIVDFQSILTNHFKEESNNHSYNDIDLLEVIKNEDKCFVLVNAFNYIKHEFDLLCFEFNLKEEVETAELEFELKNTYLVISSKNNIR